MPKKALVVGLLLLVLSMGVGIFFVYSENGNDAETYFPLKGETGWVYKATYADNNTNTQVVLVVGHVNNNSRVGLAINQLPVAELLYTRNENGIFRTKIITPNGPENYDPPQMVLPSKITVGMSWSWESSDKKEKETAKVIGAEKVTVPAGTFDTIVVQYEGVLKDGTQYTEKTWFAKDVGYVKVSQNNNGKLVSTKELIEFHSAK